MWSNEHFGGHCLTSHQNAWTYFIETYHSHSLPGPHDTDDSLKVMGSEVNRQHFLIMHFFGRGVLIDGDLLSKAI